VFQGIRPVVPLAQDMPSLTADVSSPFGQFGVPANYPVACYLLGDPVIGEWIRWDEQTTTVLPAAIVRMVHSAYRELRDTFSGLRRAWSNITGFVWAPICYLFSPIVVTQSAWFAHHSSHPPENSVLSEHVPTHSL